VEIAAALASLAQGRKPLFMEPRPTPRGERAEAADRDERSRLHEPARQDESAPAVESATGAPSGKRKGERNRSREHDERTHAGERERNRPREFERRTLIADGERNRAGERDERTLSDEPRGPRGRGAEDMETYRIEVGREHGVEPGNIMGAIANEAELPGKRIGRIVIRGDHSFVDLPVGMPKEIFLKLQKVVVAGQKLRISRALKSHVQRLRNERPHARKSKRGTRH
jgi:ATP-dependent RNA helicase DeaD